MPRFTLRMARSVLAICLGLMIFDYCYFSSRIVDATIDNKRVLIYEPLSLLSRDPFHVASYIKRHFPTARIVDGTAHNAGAISYCMGAADLVVILGSYNATLDRSRDAYLRPTVVLSFNRTRPPVDHINGIHEIWLDIHGVRMTAKMHALLIG